ncbi:MAG: glycosyltransferase family 4 protein [Actinomycetota bacterium]
MIIDQLLPSLASRDAIGVHALRVQEALARRGITGSIYYGTASSDVAGLGKSVDHLPAHVDDRILLYHSSIGSVVFDALRRVTDPIAVDYHNITPASELDSWEPAIAGEVALGRVQLDELASMATYAVADSEYNRLELDAAGFGPSRVAPLLVDTWSDPPSPDAQLTKNFASRGPGQRWIFVGKISPHKGTHHLIAALAAMRTLYDPLATLTLVGSPISDRYRDALSAYLHRLGLDDAVKFPGSLSPEELEAYWQASDLFLCLSHHEGFGVPIVEAMAHGLPVIAHGVTAIPETVGNAGILLPGTEALRAATAAHRVATDEVLREEMVARGYERVSSFDLSLATEAFCDALLAGLGE